MTDLLWVVISLQWGFMVYLVALTASYVALDIVAIIHLRHYMEERVLDGLPHGYSGFEPQISILVPAYNEEATITDNLRSLLQLSYSEYEIIAINDGSKDSTLETMIREFQLTPFPEAYNHRLKTKPIRAIYHSATYPNLRVIDKENGGKADSLNAGIEVSRYPLFCCIDADSILQRDSLNRVVQPFLDDPRTVACGGTVRIANGCEVQQGFLTKVGLPKNILALFQIVEYLRAFLFGRLGWSPMNAMLIISGAFGLFHKETVIGVGGYMHNTIGEDMELVVRLHRHLRLAGKPYRITFVPDPVCWTEAPEDLRTLKNQRIRWQRGLCESLMNNRELLCHRRGGTPGWLAFPFMLLFEALGGVIEVIGYGLMTISFIMGWISFSTWLILFAVAISLGILLSVSAFLLEELSFHLYPQRRQVFLLLAAAVIENFGYRQINAIWKTIGFWRWLRGKQGGWGTMTRTASWQAR
ncbi:MAG: glycosyltransferase [Nitrospiraceae bacterium]